MSNGFVQTTADEQYQRGLEAGRKERARLTFLYGGTKPRHDLTRTFAEQIESRVKFDTTMAETQPPVFAQFHLGRIAGMTEVQA